MVVVATSPSPPLLRAPIARSIPSACQFPYGADPTFLSGTLCSRCDVSPAAAYVAHLPKRRNLRRLQPQLTAPKSSRRRVSDASTRHASSMPSALIGPDTQSSVVTVSCETRTVRECLRAVRSKISATTPPRARPIGTVHSSRNPNTWPAGYTTSRACDGS
mgnify:CR=1 FL=1